VGTPGSRGDDLSISLHGPEQRERYSGSLTFIGDDLDALTIRVRAVLAALDTRISDIYDDDSGEIFLPAASVIFNGDLSLKDETGAAIHFYDVTDGIAGSVGPAQHLIASAVVDRLGFRGVSGMEFSGDDGATRHWILGVDGNHVIRSEGFAYTDYHDLTDGQAGVVGAAAHIITSAAVDRLGLRGTAGVEISGDAGVTRHWQITSSGHLVGRADTDTIIRAADDATDAARLILCGGDSSSTDDGSVLVLCGNEHAVTPGGLRVHIGNVAGAEFHVLRSDGNSGFQVTGSDGSCLFSSTNNDAWVFNSTHADGGYGEFRKNGTATLRVGGADALAIATGNEGIVDSPNGTLYVEAASSNSDIRLTANRDIRLSAGTGLVRIDSGTFRYGTHSAIGAETVTGYITIQDSAGNTRKLAVVS
jgi:hypothetical protein